MKYLLPICLLLSATLAQAQEPACNEDSGYPLATVTSDSAPDRFIVPCVCLNWDITNYGNHYHVYVDGVLVSNQIERAYLQCALVKDVTHEISIEAVSGWRNEQTAPIGDPYFVQWSDLGAEQTCLQWAPAECLEGERIIPCP